MLNRIDLGQFEVPSGSTRFDELTYVRRWVRAQLRGELAPCKSVVDAVWQDGEIQRLEFDESVGYPTNMPGRDWLEEWKKEVVG